MADITQIISETIDSLNRDELIEAFGLVMTLKELNHCVSVLNGLGDDFADARTSLQRLIGELDDKRLISYTWGVASDLFCLLIREEDTFILEAFANWFPSASLDSSDVALLKAVMLRLRRKPINQGEIEKARALLARLGAATEDVQLESEVFELDVMLQAPGVAEKE